MTEYELNFGDCLFKRMYECHMTQSALSDISGIPRPTIYRYLNDEKRMPNIKYAYKIARALGMTLDELVKEWNDISDEELFGYGVRRDEVSEHPKRRHGENDR